MSFRTVISWGSKEYTTRFLEEPILFIVVRCGRPSLPPSERCFASGRNSLRSTYRSASSNSVQLKRPFTRRQDRNSSQTP